jgi:Phage tail tube protein
VSRIGGTLYIKQGSEVLPIGEGDVSYDLGYPTLKTIKGKNKVLGFDSETGEPSIEFTGVFVGDYDPRTLFQARDQEFTVALQNGWTFVLFEASYVNGSKLSDNGTFSAKLVGKSAELIK